MKCNQLIGAFCAGVLSLGVATVNAASCAGGGFVPFGSTPDFEACYDPSATGLFGTPSLIGSNIIFSISDFSAESLNGSELVAENSTIHIRIMALSEGYVLDEIYLLERGDYVLDGSGSTVDLGGQLRVDDLINVYDFATDNITSSSDLTINDNQFHNWTASAVVSIDWENATFIDFAIENLLEAYTAPGESGSQAFIEKKFAADGVVVRIGPAEVPVPAALWLFGSGLLGLVGIARRKAA